MIFVLTSQNDVFAEDEHTYSNAEVEKRLARSEALLNSFKNDSVLLVISPILSQFKESNSLNTKLGLHARLVEAIALEQKQLGDSALTRLLPIMENSKSMKFWDIYTRSCIDIALIHEKINKHELSLEYLLLAKESIEEHELARLYPLFAIRMSSWYRLFGKKDTAIFYAKEALRTAPKFSLKLEEATAHMLLSMMVRLESPELLKHSLRAIEIYNELEDHVGSSAMYYQIASSYYKNGKYDQALIFNDSSIVAVNRAIAGGHNEYDTGFLYCLRGEIYKAMKNYDSAWFFMGKGHQYAIKLLEDNIDTKIAEIDTKYNNLKKQNEIEDQKNALLRRNWLLFGAFFVLISMTIMLIKLYRNFNKQKAAKLLLAQQNDLIQRQTNQLKDIDATKSRFFANISHELRTPLTLILGPINKLISDGEVNPKQLGTLTMAKKSATELLNLVNQILDIGKIDAGKMEIHHVITSVPSFFKTLFAKFESLSYRKEIIYRSIIDGSAETTAYIDREKYRCIVNNLLSNAFKFTPVGGTIHASVNIGSDKIIIMINNSGATIHPDDIPNIFDRYYQSNHSDISATGGTGLGLAICQEYTHILGGTITVTSDPTEGTTFRVETPLLEAQESADDLQTFVDEAIDHNANNLSATELQSRSFKKDTKSSILLVEDNLDLQSYIQLLLGADYQITIANHGKEALEKIASKHFDLILSDLMMPVMDGYAFLEMIKSHENTRTIPVIMLTARAEIDDKLRALRIGVDDYLVKPFDEQELRARIENLLRNSETRKLAVTERNELQVVVPEVSVYEDKWLKSFEAYVLNNLNNENLSVPVMAEELSVSESTLFRRLKCLTGLSPFQYIQEVRLNYARRVIEQGEYDSISRVASSIGYKDVRTFSRSFKNRFGKSPTEFVNG